MIDPWVPAVLLVAGLCLVRATANWVHRRGSAPGAGPTWRFLERVRRTLADED